MESTWYQKTAAETFELLKTQERGLDHAEVTRRLTEYGPNQLPEARPPHVLILFIRQFQSPLIYLLLAASFIVFFLGEVVDAAIILAVLVFNAMVGTIQEGKAQNTLRALKQFVTTDATVMRDGKELVIPDHAVVPGDILLVQAGDKIAADARILASNTLTLDEAALTGESEPVHKVSDVIAQTNLVVADQRNMLLKGTHVVAGHGSAIVVATGTKTTIGQISAAMTQIDAEIPLKANIRSLSHLIIATVATISAILFFVGISSGKSIQEMFATVVSLSVSIIPEGLPIVMTLVLATGVWRMSKRNALVKRLQAVEALGQARVIFVDKTGTITKNELMVQKVYIPSHAEGNEGSIYDIGGVGYEPKGDVRFGGTTIDPLNHPELLFVGKIAAFCANARAAFLENEQRWKAFGEPTEAALFVFAEKLGFHKEILEQESPCVSELPFSYTTKYHATVHDVHGQHLLVVAGAPEAIMAASSRIWTQRFHEGGSIEHRPMHKEDREALDVVAAEFSDQGLRVLGLAVRTDAPEELTHAQVQHLTFVGFVGMKDVLRPEVSDALERSRAAGMSVVMITGDHARTARAIAKDAGIWRVGDTVLTGAEIDICSDAALVQHLSSVSVFARVTPEHKLRIVHAYKRTGQVVAMTGDGVNDALSLVAADLGVAMGKIGTEVAKEAADIVLLDDNFGSIVSAVEEGRSIYKTIKKVILYLFSTSVGEVLTISGALFIGYPLPLLPAQIIWLNFVTDGFLDVALAMEPKEEGLLKSNFERPKKYLIDRLMAWRMLWMAIPMTAGTLVLFSMYVQSDLARALTVALTTLAVFQWFNAWNCRHESQSVFQSNPFTNRFLVAATSVVIALQLIAMYTPVMQRVLKTVPLTIDEWAMIIPVGASILVVEEIRKFIHRTLYPNG